MDNSMTMKTVPFDLLTIQTLIKKYPTPFHLYDETGILESAKDMLQSFTWAPQFTNFFAVKALPNPSILQLLKTAGMGVDCSSLAELVLAERVGFSGDQIMFTSNDTAADEFVKANELGAIINLDDISHIPFLERSIGHLPELLSFRFNPGPERVGNEFIGNPAEAKYGLTREQLLEAYKLARSKGVRRFGLHTMLASNELDPSYFIETARMLFELAVELQKLLNNSVEFINLGGGFGIPYTLEQTPLNMPLLSKAIQKEYDAILGKHGLRPKVFFECGRYVTGPYGYLVSTVLHIKNTYRDYVGLDASMANLMRPGMYGAYHHITVLGKEQSGATHTYDVTGSLCENNDKFAIQRPLPKIVEGDIVVLHDTGAHGHSMGFNYNGKLRSAELLLTKDGDFRLIRRAETLDDYFATLA
jgi:diaminopimelate decarboxylase